MTHLFRQGEDDVMTVHEQKIRERFMAIAGFALGIFVASIIMGVTFTYQVKHGDLTNTICYINELTKD